MHFNYFKIWQLFSWEVHNMTDSSMKPNLPDECATPLLSCYLMATIRAVRKGQLSSTSYFVFSKDSPFMIKKPSSQYWAMLKCLVKTLVRPLGFLTLYLTVMKKLKQFEKVSRFLENFLCNLLDGLSKLWQHHLKDWENLNQYLYHVEDLIIHFWFSLLKNTRGDSRGNFRISWLMNVPVECVS